MDAAAQATQATQAVFATFDKLLQEAARKAGDRPSFAEALARVGREFRVLRNTYAMATAGAQIKMSCRESRHEGYRDFSRVASRHDFAGLVHRLGAELVDAVARELAAEQRRPRAAPARPARGRPARAPPTRRERDLQALLGAADRLGCTPDARAAKAAARRAPPAARDADDCERCVECDADLKVDGERSEAHCPECHRIFEMHGVVYEEAHFRSQEGQRSKSGCFNPNTHCHDWLVRIQSLESETEIGEPNDPENQHGEKVVALLRAEARSMNRLLALLTIEDVRTLLSRLGRTDLNRNSALLLKKLTGRDPPVLSEDKKMLAEMMFAAANAARTAVSSLERSNRSYYPYYIFKILDLVLSRDDPDRLLLCYIHMQSKQTLDSNDDEWRKICAVTGWEWRATNVAQLEGYRTRFGGKK